MCPACILSELMVIVGAASTGALSLVIANTLRRVPDLPAAAKSEDHPDLNMERRDEYGNHHRY